MSEVKGALRLAMGVAGLLGAYAVLSSFLPEHPQVQPATVAPGAEVAPDSHDDAATGCEHDGCEDGGGHACRLKAKGMYSRFQAAIQKQRGATHTVAVDARGIEAVAGQVNLGLKKGHYRKGLLEGLAQRHGLKVVRVNKRLGLALVETRKLPVAALLPRLRAEQVVRFAEPNYVARVALTPNDPFFPITGQKSGGLESAWDVQTGNQAVVVAVLDTGADTGHPDLTNRLVPGFDFVNNTAVMTDDNGHGTAMCGIVGAEGQNSAGIAGVAFNGRVMPVKVADANGTASVANVVAGIDYAIQQNAKVINLSLGAPVGSQALQDAVNRALAAGLVVVASAGNDPVHHEVFPAAYPGVISATTMGQDGGLGFDAVIAPGVEVGAPGEQHITTLPGDVYGFVTGSSAAAAFTSGTAALVWAQNQALSSAQVTNILKHSQDEVSALKDLRTTYRFGRLNAGRAVRRASATYLDVAVTDVRCYPDKPIAGQPATIVVEVTNEGQATVTGLPVRVARILTGVGQRIEIGVLVVNNLVMGEVRELTLNFTAPAAGRYNLRAIASARPGETEVNDNTRQRDMIVDATQEVDLRIVERTITDPTVAAGTITASVTVENRGTAPANNVLVSADVTPAGPTIPAIGAGAPAGAGLGQAQTIPTIAVGGRATVQFTYTIPNPAPTGIQRLRVVASPLQGEVKTADNQGFLDFLLGTSQNLRGLYQQSNAVDVIHDAPWRIDPNRPFVPVQLFVASKGGSTNTTKLRLERYTIDVRDTPTGSPTRVFDDARGANPSVAPQGLAIADELGNGRTNDLNVFSGSELDINGRHEILRVPRAAFGVAAQPTAPVNKYVDTKLSWEQRRVLLWVFTTTRSGDHRKVLRVRFSSAGFPSLPGDNHYHDVHHHTIAEWYFGSPLDIFAPRKAYGGPLQMVFDSGYAMGILQAPTAAAARMRIITTDHSSFNNRTTPDPDSADHRPPFGPQSVAQNPGMGQLEAYRAIFGKCAGEEVAFKQDIPMPRIPFVNQILNMLPGIPIGAHMLLYGADHVEGPWHGGGWLKGPGNPNIDVNLFPLLNDVAKNRQQTQGDSFAYAAHPYSGQGWNDSNYERAFGLGNATRSKDEVHDASNEFVVKGLEFFNGRGTRSLPSGQIDFQNLNPWSDATFSQGEPDWDKGLWDGVTLWHKALAQTLHYSFSGSPEVRFVRKIYQAGGSDAHGDFNFSTGRAATPLNVQMTYNVGDEAWYAVRTYCFGDGKAGATSEDRWLEAYRDGNSVVTDGPVVSFSFDANGRFDSGDLRWHDGTRSWEDADGRIGGNGGLDGGFTALVERGSATPVFRYRYATTDEWGPIASILLYKTEAGNANPVRNRPSGFLGFSSYDQITGVNTFNLGGVNADHDHPLDPTKEGTVTKNTAWTLGAYTGGNPDQVDLGPDNYRCWTNPVFAVPFDASVTASGISNGTIPAGGLTVTFTFDVSMDPSAYTIEVKPLDASGNSTGKSDQPHAVLTPASGSGWSDRAGVKSSVYTVTNTTPIALGGDEYPAGSGDVSFVVYWRTPPKDHAGNALNPIATTFTEGHVAGGPQPTPIGGGGGGGGGSGGGGSGGGGGTSPVTSTTNPGSTGGGSASTAGGSSRKSSGGVCSLQASSSPAPSGSLPLLLLLGALVLVRRRLT